MRRVCVSRVTRRSGRALLSLAKYIAARIELATFAIHLVMSLVLRRMRKLFDVLDGACLPIARAAGARQIGSTDSASDLADVLSRHTRVPGSPGWMMPRAAQRSVG